MEQVVERENLIKKYLLGELADEKQAEVEIRLLTDHGYFKELLLVEDEITDDFLFGILSDHEQERTRNYFLAVPERRQKLRFAKALEQYASTTAPSAVAATVWENTLAEAHKNRVLLSSLINADWLGLHLLVLLRETPQSEAQLVSKVKATNATNVAGVLTRLILSDVIEESGGLFSCTELGIKIIQKIEANSGAQFTP